MKRQWDKRIVKKHKPKHSKKMWNEDGALRKWRSGVKEKFEIFLKRVQKCSANNAKMMKLQNFRAKLQSLMIKLQNAKRKMKMELWRNEEGKIERQAWKKN